MHDEQKTEGRDKTSENVVLYIGVGAVVVILVLLLIPFIISSFL